MSFIRMASSRAIRLGGLVGSLMTAGQEGDI
jgi:hypothetical protein